MSDTTSKRLYEGLFLFNPSQINSSVAQATELTQEILEAGEHPLLEFVR